MRDFYDSNSARAHGDLSWYWNSADGEMGLQSNFGPMVNRLNGLIPNVIRHDLDPSKLDAARRARRIATALITIGPEQTWLLRQAFGPPEHPPPYETDLAPLGHLAGIALVCAATTIAHRKSNTSRPVREWLSRQCLRQVHSPAGFEAMQEIRLQAETLFNGCLASYIRARGGEAQ